mmetsp:Transcript_58861/g.192050  ORF Transcript_58861/g.192050 Transcript_58861/m.192050 type:complete len:203 (-) Transcript_58861:148-756(-)
MSATPTAADNPTCDCDVSDGGPTSPETGTTTRRASAAATRRGPPRPATPLCRGAPSACAAAREGTAAPPRPCAVAMLARSWTRPQLVPSVPRPCGVAWPVLAERKAPPGASAPYFPTHERHLQRDPPLFEPRNPAPPPAGCTGPGRARKRGDPAGNSRARGRRADAGPGRPRRCCQPGRCSASGRRSPTAPPMQTPRPPPHL